MQGIPGVPGGYMKNAISTNDVAVTAVIDFICFVKEIGGSVDSRLALDGWLVREREYKVGVAEAAAHCDLNRPGELPCPQVRVVNVWRRNELHGRHLIIFKDGDLFAFRSFNLGDVDIAHVPLDLRAEPGSPVTPR